MIAVALAALVAGGFWFWLLAVVVGLFMMAEWSDLHRTTPKTKRTAQFALSIPLAIVSPLAAGPGFFDLGLLAGAFFFVAIVTRRGPFAAGIFYVGLPIFALLAMRGQPGGLILTLWAMALVWACDIGAYAAGRTIGGAKLAPRISPAKTWAGLGGGVMLATVLAAAMHVSLALPVRLVAATPLLAVLAQGGDLFESWLKRRAGVKDSGNILPGHGGVLDRIDGIVPVAPIAALIVLMPRLFA